MTYKTGPQDGASLEGTVPELSTPQQRHEAFDAAFDYRGDVTISTSDGRDVQGYVFDRRSEGPSPYVRIIQADSDERVVIPYDTIRGLRFSGRDTAAGKNWQTWVEKYETRKAAGENANADDDRSDETQSGQRHEATPARRPGGGNLSSRAWGRARPASGSLT
jgi:hypothetical protein